MLIEIRAQLNGTLRQDIDRVASAIREAKSGLRYSAHNFVVFGPVWERNYMGQVVAVRYRCSDTHERGDYRIWDLKPGRELEFHAQGSAKAA